MMTRFRHCLQALFVALAFSASPLLADTIRYSITNLGELGFFLPASAADGINNRGQVVGGSWAPSGFHAFLWQSGSGMQDLGTLPRRHYSFASGINDSGQVVGTSTTDLVFGEDRAFLWQSGSGMQDLGTLGGFESRANDINNSGQVVGASRTPSGEDHAFFWQSGSGMQDLGTLGGLSSYAYGINDSGQVVGTSEAPSGLSPFLYSGGQMLDLNTLLPANSGWDLMSARAINDAGQIVGNGLYQGEYRAFLMTPVPEPATYALCGLTLVALVVLRRRG